MHLASGFRSTVAPDGRNNEKKGKRRVGNTPPAAALNSVCGIGNRARPFRARTAREALILAERYTLRQPNIAIYSPKAWKIVSWRHTQGLRVRRVVTCKSAQKERELLSEAERFSQEISNEEPSLDVAEDYERPLELQQQYDDLTKKAQLPLAATLPQLNTALADCYGHDVGLISRHSLPRPTIAPKPGQYLVE